MDKLIVRGTEINVQWDLKRDDFLSLTDIAKIKDSDNPRYIIQNWLRNRNTIEFLGVWEKSNVQNDVENSILNVIGKSETNDMPQTFGIVAEHSKLFIKCNVIGKTVEIILIEPYTDMDT